MIYMAGLDLGQARDPSAIIVAEVAGSLVSYPPDAGVYARKIECPPIARFDVRHCETYPLGTSYKRICDDVTAKLKQIKTAPVYLAVDKTGVGAAVIEHFDALNPVKIWITGGIKATVGNEPQEFHVPKRELVAGVQVALQNSVLRISDKLKHAALLQRELENFRGKFTAAGHETFEAWRESDHDDLVLATAIALWSARLCLELSAQHALAALNRPPDVPPISPY